MSLLGEYIKLIPSGLRNADKVAEGVLTQIKMELGTLPEDEEKEVFRRRMICAACPFMSENAKEIGVYFTNRKDEHCTQCGCPLTTRTASLSSKCGIDDYNKRNPDKPMELKWDVYNKE